MNIATGNKYHRRQDLSLPGGLELIRHYNSRDLNPHSFGTGWRGSYSRKIDVVRSDSAGDASVRLTRDDGAVSYWRIENSAIIPPPDARGRLEAAIEGGEIMGFTYREGSVTETFGPDGSLLSLEDGQGGYLRFGYQDGSLVRATASSGRALVFVYDAMGRVSRVSSSGGSAWAYHYDQKGNLSRVEYPDGASRSYHYEHLLLPHALTGVSDENGRRIRSWEPGRSATTRACPSLATPRAFCRAALHWAWATGCLPCWSVPWCTLPAKRNTCIK